MSSKRVPKQTGAIDAANGPEEWETVRLGKISRIVNGFGFPIRFQGKKTAEYVFVKVSDTNLDGNEKYITTTNNTIDDTDLHEMSVRIYPKGTILFPKIGMVINQNKKRILATDGTFDNNLMGVIPKRDVVDGEFLYYYFLGRFDLRKIANRTTMPSIRKSEVEKLNVHLPPLAEQQGITRILSCVDEVIQETDVVIKKAEMLKQALMQRLLTPGIGEKPKEWEVVCLGDVLSEKPRNGIYKPRGFYGKGDARIIQLNDLYSIDRVLKVESLSHIELTDVEKERFQVQNGDILVNRVSKETEGIGKMILACLNEETVVFESNMFRIRLDKSKILPEYLSFFGQSALYKKGVFKVAKITNRPSISHDDLLNIRIVKPPIPEQQYLTDVFATIEDKLIKETARKISLVLLKEGLMQTLLTGKVRVKVD